ncbi:hypothetical protein SCG7109_AM_00020 [Chlamydiales bacterium SCGC AG-110-M15]|nr:hypothetical protein SCG7109_AM_00020 [Chlamydiales bacterium SCGC AG-110-M15]
MDRDVKFFCELANDVSKFDAMDYQIWRPAASFLCDFSHAKMR